MRQYPRERLWSESWNNKFRLKGTQCLWRCHLHHRRRKPTQRDSQQSFLRLTLRVKESLDWQRPWIKCKSSIRHSLWRLKRWEAHGKDKKRSSSVLCRLQKVLSTLRTERFGKRPRSMRCFNTVFSKLRNVQAKDWLKSFTLKASFQSPKRTPINWLRTRKSWRPISKGLKSKSDPCRARHHWIKTNWTEPLATGWLCIRKRSHQHKVS
jgi:hypothetical protein